MNQGLSFDDVLLVPNYCGFDSRKEVTTTIQLGDYEFRIPICSANMDTITGAEMAAFMCNHGGLGILHRFMSIEDNVKEYIRASSMLKDTPSIGVSVGVNEGLDRAKALYYEGARIFCVDVAHGHSKLTGRMIKSLRTEFKDILIIAGNVCTYAGADYLVSCGADVIKVGIGPGSVCSTRIKTGFGYPQFSAIQACAKCSRPVIADGGVRTPADVVKCFVAGATMVMIGGLLAGCDETPGEIIGDATIIQRDGSEIISNPQKVFRGMASREAFEDFYGAMPDWKTAEGVSTTVPCKGSAQKVINDLIGGLRSGLTYAGCSNVYELQRRVNWIQITGAGVVEGTPHFKCQI